MKYFFLCLFFIFLTVTSVSTLGTGINDRISLSTRQDIEQADPNCTSIDIRYLSLDDFPLLGKFRNARQINLGCKEGTFATDDKLKALGTLDLPETAYIILTNCRLVTDEGIAKLENIQSLKGLGLEGTAITDVSLEAIATKMSLSSVDVANCNNVTLKGLQNLAASKTLNELSFSTGNLTGGEILSLFDSFKNITWCQIIDPDNRLDVNVLKSRASEKNFSLVIKSTGSLQDTFGIKE